MVRLENVTKKFGDKVVLDGFSLELPQTGAVCFFGPSGCGKTTLLRLIAGLTTPEDGAVHGVQGKKVAYVFQEDRLLPWATALENVALVNKQGDPEKRLCELGLAGDENFLPHELSGGMRRRVAIARALHYDGDIIILDEPFADLDMANRETIIKIIRQRLQEKLTLLVTHDIEDAKAIGAEIIRFNGPPLTLA